MDTRFKYKLLLWRETPDGQEVREAYYMTLPEMISAYTAYFMRHREAPTVFVNTIDDENVGWIILPSC